MAAAAALLRVAMPGSIRQQATSCVAVKPAFQLGQFFVSRVSRICLRRLPIRVLSCPFQSGNSLGLRIGPPPSALGPGMAGLLEHGSVDGSRMTGGGGLRNFPGGVTKSHWKRMQEKKVKQQEDMTGSTTCFLARASIHTDTFVENPKQPSSLLKIGKAPGAAKRRVPPHGDLMMQSNAAPLAEGRLLLQRKKLKESPEGSEGEDAAVLEEKPLLSHLSQTRWD